MTNPATNPWLAMALNNAWANATLYAAFAGMSESEFTAERPGFFPSLSRTMNHIYEVDLYYLDALEKGGRGRGVFRRENIELAEPLGQAQADADMRFARFCQSLTLDQLSEVRSTEREDETCEETVAALILHLVQHQIHHRGQAHVQLSAAGIDPPQLDEFYLDFDRAPSANPYWPAI